MSNVNSRLEQLAQLRHADWCELPVRHYAHSLSLQELQVRCAEGQALLNSVLHTREDVIPSGLPQAEDRVLESLRQDWQVYQHRLAEARMQLNNVVNKLRLMEQKFQQADEWLKRMEEKINFRSECQSSRSDKEIQLLQLKVQLGNS